MCSNGNSVITLKKAKNAKGLLVISLSNVSNVAQRAALAAVTGDLEAAREMRTAYARRGQLMYEMLQAIPGVDHVVSHVASQRPGGPGRTAVARSNALRSSASREVVMRRRRPWVPTGPR